MGNRPITIGVETDKAEYTAGSTLRGKVYLSISNRQSTGVAAQVLQLRLVGKESAVIHHTSSNDGNTDNHYERSSHTFFQVDYPLYTFINQRAPSGQYEYPFQFNLPDNLPSTMKAKDGQSTCEVEYELVATLVQPGGGGGLFSSHPNSKKAISVWATATEPADSSVQHPPDDIPVHACCCCCANGSMTLEACVNKTIVQHNDSVQVQYRCQNHSSEDVHTVMIQLEQVIEWKCNSRSKKIRKILEKLEFDGGQYPELEASPPQSTVCCLMGGPSYSYVSSTPLAQEFHTAELRVPGDALDTYRGNAVSVQHILSVVLVSNGCCSSNPESATSMQVVKTFSALNNVTFDNGKISEATATAVSPSAPSDLLDTTTTSTPSAAVAHASSPYSMEPIVAEAQALPPDWNAQTAQVVEIPMAEAMVIEPSAPPLFK